MRWKGPSECGPGPGIARSTCRQRAHCGATGFLVGLGKSSPASLGGKAGKPAACLGPGKSVRLCSGLETSSCSKDTPPTILAGGRTFIYSCAGNRGPFPHLPFLILLQGLFHGVESSVRQWNTAHLASPAPSEAAPQCLPISHGCGECPPPAGKRTRAPGGQNSRGLL